MSAIPDEDALLAAMRARRGLVKPSGKVYKGGSDIGNGEVCPANPAHGKMFNMSSGNDWCPHVDHSDGKRHGE